MIETYWKSREDFANRMMQSNLCICEDSTEDEKHRGGELRSLQLRLVEAAQISFTNDR
jgi:hypothetical protein